MFRFDVHLSYASPLSPLLSQTRGQLAERRVHAAASLQVFCASAKVIVHRDEHVLPILLGLVVHRHHAPLNQDWRRRTRAPNHHHDDCDQERAVGAPEHAPYDIHMRRVKPGVGFLLWVWLVGVSMADAQTIPRRPAAGVTVSGSIVTPDKTPLQGGAVLMNPIAGDTLASHPADDVRFLPDGSFSFRNVAPGTYQIRARGQTTSGAATLFGSYRVHVSDRDVTGLRLLLRPGAIVTGTVEVQSGEGERPDLGRVRVRAPLVDGSSFADALTGVVPGDGRFRLAGVMEGEHYLGLDGLPEPWVLKQAYWRGTDLADTPFTTTSGEIIQGVRMVVSTRTNEIRGMVRDAAGGPVADAIVVISPASYKTWRAGSPRFVITRSGDDGQYRHRGLPAGEYRVTAARNLSEARVRASGARELPGVAVRLGDADTRLVDLEVLSEATPRWPAAR
jgi:hypothetical protein